MVEGHFYEKSTLKRRFLHEFFHDTLNIIETSEIQFIIKFSIPYPYNNDNLSKSFIFLS